MRRAKTIFREVGVLPAPRPRSGTAIVAVAAALALTTGCASKSPPPSPPCEQECKDAVALRALREMMKYAFNLIVQGRPVGPQDGVTDLFLSGTARIFGVVTADPLQGVTKVEHLTYVFTNANYGTKEDEPDENYDVVLDGTLTQEGIIAVQPSATTAVRIRGTDVRLAGKVYDPPLDYGPPLDYAEPGCVVDVTQSGNDVAGNFCGRKAGFSF